MTKAFRSVTLVCLLSLSIFFSLAANVALSAGTIKVTTPNGSDSWTTGSKYTIKWKKGNAGSNVKIELLRSGKVYKTVSAKTKNDGKYRWKVPSSVKSSKRYEIRITSLTNEGRSDSSDEKFTIKKTTKTTSTDVNVTSPNGGESWQQGKTYKIEWDTGDVTSKVMIELRTGSGTTASTTLEIVAETKNDGSYSWNVPITVATGSNYEIRVSPNNSGDKKDTSDSVFSITETTSLKLSSSAFKNGGKIPAKYTCDGSEASPPLKISGVPSGTKELVLFLDDLDGTPSVTNTTTDWNHWVVTNIGVKGGRKGTFRNYRVPTGAKVGRNDSGDSNYEPICPPGEKGDRTKHNYQFTLYAVDKKVTNNSSTRAQVKAAIDGSILEKKTLKGYFGD